MAKVVIDPASWEDDDGHLFLTKVNLAHGGPTTLCLRCGKKFKNCYEGQSCKSKENGRWTKTGIDSIRLWLAEGDDRETTRITNDVDEIITQLLEAQTRVFRTTKSLYKAFIREEREGEEENGHEIAVYDLETWNDLTDRLSSLSEGILLVTKKDS